MTVIHMPPQRINIDSHGDTLVLLNKQGLPMASKRPLSAVQMMGIPNLNSI
jgi:hypothetical protein